MATNSLDFLMNLRANTSSFDQGINGAKFAVSALATALAAIGVGSTVKDFIDIADSTQQMGERLKLATNNTEEYNMVQARLLELANNTFRPLEEAQEVYLSTAGTMKSLGYSTEQILAVTESLSLSFTHNATRADQAQSAQDALANSMAKGKVDADAWMSIIIGADNVVRDMAASTGRTEKQIRQLGANGQVSVKELTAALIESRDRNEELASSMENSTKDAAIALKNNLTAAIAVMNEKHHVSSRLSEAMLTLGGDMSWLSDVFDDVMAAVDTLVERYSGLGAESDNLKNVIGSLYELFKEFLSGAYELGTTMQDVLGTALSSIVILFSGFIGRTVESSENISFLTRILQGLSITLGFAADGISAIKIGLNLLTGSLFAVSAAGSSVMAALTWGELSKSFAANADLMKNKSKEYYAEANKEALAFESKGVARLKEAARTEAEVAQDKKEKALANLKEIEENENASQKKRTAAVLAYAEAAIAANDGVVSEQLKAELAAKGYAVAMNDAGDVSVEALGATSAALEDTKEKTEAIQKATEALKQADSEYLEYQKKAAIERAALEQQIQQAKASGDINELKSAQDKITQINAKEQEFLANRNQRQTELLALNQKTADGSAAAYTRASEIAEKIGINLDQSLNRVSEKFKESQKGVNDLSKELVSLGIEGDKASEVLYEAWAKWAEQAKSTAEIDAAKAQLISFEKQGVFSAKQVQMGMEYLDQVNGKLPQNISEVEKAYKLLGLTSQAEASKIADAQIRAFNVLQQSGTASMDQLKQALLNMADKIYASGDAAKIAAYESKLAYAGLETQVDSTGKTAVKSMDDLGESAHRVSRSFGDMENSAVSSIRSVKDETEDALTTMDRWNASIKAMRTPEQTSGTKASLVKNAAEIEEELLSYGYDAKRAKQIAKDIYEGTKDGLYGYKSDLSMGLGTSISALGNVGSVNQSLEKYKNYAPGAKNVSAVVGGAASASSGPAKTIEHKFMWDGKEVTLQGKAGEEDALNQLISKLKTQSKST